ncbi:MAG: DNA cytosine methyltransferase [Zestosphaera sp.]|uniref:DNA cytosine methyltransferase n=1 Tax=Thermofilum sp. TaxID=1961369 RepID=UPI0031696E2E
MGKLKTVSLFSGAGGLDWGFKEAGFEILFANDVKEAAALTYSHNFGLKLSRCGSQKPFAPAPGEVLVCDVEKVDFAEIERQSVDVVIGGPPCQDFSVVRGADDKRRGINVRRGRLYAYFVRALAALQPKAFVFENVPGLVSANKGLAYKTVVEDFQKLNLRWDEVRRDAQIRNDINNIQGYYLVYSGIANFANFGVPQQRRRLIIMGLRSDLIKHEGRLLKELKSMIEHTIAEKSRIFMKYPLTPIEVFEGKPLPDLQLEYIEAMRKWEGVWDNAGTEYARRWKEEVWDKLSMDIVKDYLTANGISRSELELEEAWAQHKSVLEELKYFGKPVCLDAVIDGTCSQRNSGKEVRERMKRIPPGKNCEFVKGTEWEVGGIGISLLYRRIHPLKPSYTIAAYGGGGTLGYHYDRDRDALKLREKARLQTFPDLFVFLGNRIEIRGQIGEAVPPLAGKRIAEMVKEILKTVEQD